MKMDVSEVIDNQAVKDQSTQEQVIETITQE